MVRNILIGAGAALLSMSAAAWAQSSDQRIVGSWDCTVAGPEFAATAQIAYGADGTWSMQAEMSGEANGDTLLLVMTTQGRWSTSGAQMRRDVSAFDVTEFRYNGQLLPQSAADEVASAMERNSYRLNILRLDATGLVLESGNGREREICSRL